MTATQTSTEPLIMQSWPNFKRCFLLLKSTTAVQAHSTVLPLKAMQMNTLARSGANGGSGGGGGGGHRLPSSDAAVPVAREHDLSPLIWTHKHIEQSRGQGIPMYKQHKKKKKGHETSSEFVYACTDRDMHVCCLFKKSQSQTLAFLPLLPTPLHSSQSLCTVAARCTAMNY